MDENYVMGGLYKGKKIIDEYGEMLCVAEVGAKGFLVKTNVQSVTKVETFVQSETAHSYKKAAIGQTVLGAGGAVMGAGERTTTSAILEVVWTEGEKSLIKVSQKYYETILAGMYKQPSLAEIENIIFSHNRAVEEKNEKDKKSLPMLLLIDIVAVILLYIVFGSTQKS